MNIEVITRVRWNDLYGRMVESALEQASFCTPKFSFEKDDGRPRIAETYNHLADKSKADILVFVHDDIQFMSPGWDCDLVEGMYGGYDVLGVVGAAVYRGGKIAGSKELKGRFACVVDGRPMVKIMSGPGVHPVSVVDGMFIATTRDHFKKTRFDEILDGLFFYDLDFCLRSKCAVTDILVSHSKPWDRYGVYPEMNGIEHYQDYFHKKHGLVEPANAPAKCSMMTLEDYQREDQLTGRTPA